MTLLITLINDDLRKCWWTADRLKSKSIFVYLEAVIGFASSTYDINEDGKAVVEVAFTSGQANVPVTVQ
jgi:hypothetical protein